MQDNQTPVGQATENQQPTVTQTTEQTLPVQTETTVVQAGNPSPRSNSFLVVLLSALLFMAVGIAGFFAYQTQTLVKEMTLLKSFSTPSMMAVQSTQLPVATTDPMANWKTYTNSTYKFSFKYPATLEDNGNISGSYTGTNVGLRSFADPKTIVEGTDAPFDGYSLYYVSDIKAMSFEQFIQNEQVSMNNSEYVVMENAKWIDVLTGVTALVTDTRGYYYIPTTDGKNAIVFAYIQKNPSFKDTFYQTLSTFKFTN